MHLAARIAFGIAALPLAFSLTVTANDPGGGTNGVGPDVTLTDNGTYVTLANGILTARITKSSAQVTSMVFLGWEYYVLFSTKLALPLAQWTRVHTNQFDADGHFVFTAARNPKAAQQLYSLRLP
jgi:hypothetical protein